MMRKSVDENSLIGRPWSRLPARCTEQHFIMGAHCCSYTATATENRTEQLLRSSTHHVTAPDRLQFKRTPFVRERRPVSSLSLLINIIMSGAFDVAHRSQKNLFREVGEPQQRRRYRYISTRNDVTSLICGWLTVVVSTNANTIIMPEPSKCPSGRCRISGSCRRLPVVAALVACLVACVSAAPVIEAPPFWHFAVIVSDSSGSSTKVLKRTSTDADF